MTQFGLIPGWRFAFDDAKRRFGACHRGWDKKITLSRPLTLLNDRAEVEDTIRHEIAHALCPPKCGHGPAWKVMCKRTGAKPERCYDREDVDAPKGDWQATCGVCRTVYTKFRHPKHSTYFCVSKTCKHMYRSGAWVVRPVLTFKHKNALPEAAPHPEQRRKAIEAVKARLRDAEPPSSMMQCVKCDDKSLGCTVCPGCGGELLLATVLQAQKEELKRKIAELERKVGK